MTSTTIFKATFRARGYSEEDLRVLRSVLEPLGALRTKPIHPPEVGGAAEFMLIIEFIGQSAAQALIGAATLKLLSEVSTALRTFFQHKRTNSQYPADFGSFRLSYDDLDIVVTAHAEEFTADLKANVTRIHEHLTSAPLANEGIDYIQLPAELRDGRFYAAVPQSVVDRPSDASFRYWFVGRLDPAPMLNDVYDSQERVLIGVPFEDLPTISA